jgi:choline dehydrogenase-like flavoprotein
MAAVAAPALRKGAVTKQDKRLRAFLWFIAVLSFLFIVDYLAGGLARDEEFRFVANSVAKDALFVALAVIGALNVRRFASICVPLLILGHGALIVANGLMLLTDQEPVEILGMEVQATTFALVWMAADAVIVAALFLLHRAAQRERLGLKYLSPLEFASLTALADVLIHGRDEQVDPARIASNVDAYLHRLDAPGKGRVRGAFIVLSPFALLAPQSRYDVIQGLFLNAVSDRRVPRFLRPITQAIIRAAQQFVFLGYYGDTASHDSVGYKVFSERGPAEDLPHQTVKTISRSQVRDPDIVVVGSGAAGAILAYRLAERHPERRVLVLERGPHVHPTEFKEDEVRMYLDLYNEGALQLARDFRFSVLQGMCVGGSTVINNAVCFDAPDDVLRDWNDTWDAGLTVEGPEGLKASYLRTRKWLQVQPADPDEANPVGEYFVRGVERLGLPGEAHLVDVNIRKCLGCGYCNIGCSHGSKTSMLDFVLPEAQRRFRDRVQVLPDCKVEEIETADGHARGLRCDVDGHKMRIPARTVVVAAGAINSSVLLLNSGIRRSQAGRRLHFNIVSPLTAEFPEQIRAYDGLQISHYWQPPPGNGERYVLETWFNPPATHSLVMPGWFHQHYENMRRYSYMGAGGVLVGTTVPGQVRAAKSGPAISYKPGDDDMDQLIDGLKQLTRVYLAAGAKRVMPATYKWHEFKPEGGDPIDDLDEYRRDNEGLSLNSAHPQGGNAISRDWRQGVVDENFRVHGMDNVYVCDASVFPTSVTVNPQLTVMALADYAAARMAV